MSSSDEEENVYCPTLFKFHCSSQYQCCFGKHFGYHTRGNLGVFFFFFRTKQRFIVVVFLNKVLPAKSVFKTSISRQALFLFATSACKAPPTLLKTGELLLFLPDSAQISPPGGDFPYAAGGAGPSLRSRGEQLRSTWDHHLRGSVCVPAGPTPPPRLGCELGGSRPCLLTFSVRTVQRLAHGRYS